MSRKEAILENDYTKSVSDLTARVFKVATKYISQEEKDRYKTTLNAIIYIFKRRNNASDSEEEQQRHILRYLLKSYFNYMLAFIIKKQIPDYKDTRIEYVVCVEKIALDGFLGTKEDMKELFIQSGLVSSTENSVVISTEAEVLGS
jgi:hypothetical protein